MGSGLSGIDNKRKRGLQDHFAKENERVSDFMEKRSGMLEMENGQILEHYTMDYMKKMILREAKSSGGITDDEMISIRYNDGSIAVYTGGDDTDNMKLSNISGVIYDNESTTAYAGKGVEIVNYKELYPKDYPDEKGYDDDWRMDFTR